MVHAVTFGEKMRALMAERGISLHKLAKTIPANQGYLSRISRDLKQPSPEMAKRIDTELNAGGELAALRPPSPLRAGINGEYTPDDEERLSLALQRPSRLDMVVVESLRVILAAQRRLDDTLGPAAILPATAVQAAATEKLLRQARGPVREALAPVAAEYVQFHGWLLAELRDDRAAVRRLTDAEGLADEIENGELAAQAANFRAYLARQQDLTAYWLTPDFQHINIGLALAALGEHGAAAEHLAAGLGSLPADQQQAEWTREYRKALDASGPLACSDNGPRGWGRHEAVTYQARPSRNRPY